ncbi:MAG: hypothetical protein Q4B85_12845 [Lachnospiraceae bacterium]|nr:hypothetical protein [Lachnospiraceae bacterium]
MSYEKSFIGAKELSEVVGISISSSYKVIRQMNEELEMQFTVSGGRHSVLERPFSEANGRLF